MAAVEMMHMGSRGMSTRVEAPPNNNNALVKVIRH